MPTYVLINTETGEEYEEFFLSYTALQEHLAANPSLAQGVHAINIVSGHGSSFKTDNGFKDLLKQIKKNNLRSDIKIN